MKEEEEMRMDGGREGGRESWMDGQKNGRVNGWIQRERFYHTLNKRLQGDERTKTVFKRVESFHT